MKKAFKILLYIALIFAFTACGDGGGGTEYIYEPDGTAVVLGSFRPNAVNPYNGLSSSVGYQIVSLPSEGRDEVMRVAFPNRRAAAYYRFTDQYDVFEGQEVTISFSVDVKRTGAAGDLTWVYAKNDSDTNVHHIQNAAKSTWHKMSHTWTEIFDTASREIYLNTHENNSENTVFYIDNFTISIGTAGLEFTLINNGTAYRVSKGTVSGGAVVIPALHNGLPVTEVSGFSDTDITRITIPSSIKSINDYAFMRCEQLTTLIFAEGSQLERIGEHAFHYSHKLAGDLTLPNGVKYIGESAFQHCLALDSITIPESVTFVGIKAFADWTDTQTINIDGVPVGWHNNWKQECNAKIVFKSVVETITLPRAEETENWHYFYNIPSEITEGRILEGDIYTFTYSLFSDVAMAYLWLGLQDRMSEWWENLSENEFINNIPTNALVSGTIEFIATKSASSTEQAANIMHLGTNASNVTGSPTLYFTKFELVKIKAKVPGAVASFSAGSGNGQVTLLWSAPSDNGGATITGYEVTMDNWATKVTKTAIQTTHTFTGLTNETEYTFKVRAVNAVGAGAESTRTATPTVPNTYVITKNEGTFKATYNGTVVSTNSSIQTVINTIRTDTKGANAIQFGNGIDVLDIGMEKIHFTVSSGTWGVITLTGKLISSGNEVNGSTIDADRVTIISTANIANTNTATDISTIANFGGDTGSITINGGTVSGNGTAIMNFQGTLTIKGGTVSANTAISNHDLLNINGGEVKGVNCAVHNTSHEGRSGTIKMSGGTLSSTAANGKTIDNQSSGTITITEGTVSATGVGSNAVYNGAANGTVTIIKPSTEISGNVHNVTFITEIVGSYSKGASNPYVPLVGDFDYQIVNLTADDGNESRTNVMRIINSAETHNIVRHSLDSYLGQNIKVELSADVKRIGGTNKDLNWTMNVDSANFPVFAQQSSAAENTWHTITGSWTGKANSLLYLYLYENQNIGATYYIDNVIITVTVSGTPGAVQNISATPGNGEVALSWTAPSSDGGSPITGYQVSSNNGSSWVTASTNTSHTFTGLTNGTQYSFKVRAVNAIGNGAENMIMATPSGGSDPTASYIITEDTTWYTARKNGNIVGTPNNTPQQLIDAIRTDAGGKDCTIQFEDLTKTLDIAAFSIEFKDTWGKVTLTGKITSSTANTISISGGVSVTSTAEIGNTGSGGTSGGAIRFDGSGTLTISSGKVSATGTSDYIAAIRNVSNGKVIINGGDISSLSSNAIYNVCDSGRGTIEINNGTVSTSGPNNMSAIANNYGGIVNIKGGTVSAINGTAVSNGNNREGSNGELNISGGTVSSAGLFPAISNIVRGTTSITGGTIEATAGDSSALTNSGTVIIDGGTVQKTTASTASLSLSGYAAIFNNSSGKVDIISGTVSAPTTGLYNFAVYNQAGGEVTIGAGAIINGKKNWD